MSSIPWSCFVLSLAFLAGCSRPAQRELTQAEVDSFLAKKEMHEQAKAWRRDIQNRAWGHPDGPRPLKFPEVAIVDEPMWNYVEHAIMKRSQRVWYWSDQPTASVASWVALPTAYGTATNGSIVSTCFAPNNAIIIDAPVGTNNQILGNTWIVR